MAQRTQLCIQLSSHTRVLAVGTTYVWPTELVFLAGVERNICSRARENQTDGLNICRLPANRLASGAINCDLVRSVSVYGWALVSLVATSELISYGLTIKKHFDVA